MYSIGVDIGGTKIKFLIMNSKNNLLNKWEITTNIKNKGASILSDIASEISNFMYRNELESSSISVIGVGVPGPVDSNKGVVKVAVNLGWGEVDVKKILESKLSIPVYVLNDANAAALGEKTEIESKAKNVLFVTLGTGVGGGIIIDHEIMIGPNFSSGEIGHIPIQMDEKRTCGCGNINCLETYASANGLFETIQKHTLNNTKKSELCVDNETFFIEVAKKNVIALEILDIYCEQLAYGLASVVNSIDIEVIIIGGGLSNAGDLLIEPLNEKIKQKLFNGHKETIVIKKAKLGNDAGTIGAISYGLNRKEE